MSHIHIFQLQIIHLIGHILFISHKLSKVIVKKTQFVNQLCILVTNNTFIMYNIIYQSQIIQLTSYNYAFNQSQTLFSQPSLIFSLPFFMRFFPSEYHCNTIAPLLTAIGFLPTLLSYPTLTYHLKQQQRDKHKRWSPLQLPTLTLKSTSTIQMLFLSHQHHHFQHHYTTTLA